MSANLSVQNIVATASLGKPVQLTRLARVQSNTEYNPEQFPGLVLRIKKPKSAVLVFSSGNLVCTGTKSVAQVKQVISSVIKILRKINIKVKPNSPDSKIVEKDNGTIVYVKSKAENNKANIEVIRLFSRRYKSARILRGLKSSKKLVCVEA